MDMERMLEIVTNEPAATPAHRLQAAEQLARIVAAHSYDAEKRWRVLDAILEPIMAVAETCSQRDVVERANRILEQIEAMETARQESELVMSA